jgi:hypothetical protein
MGPLEKLHGLFVFLGLSARVERPEVSALAGPGVRLSRVEPILTRSQFANHLHPSPGVMA